MRDVIRNFLIELSGHKRVYGDIRLDDFSEDLGVSKAHGATELVFDELNKKKFARLTSHRNQNGILKISDTLTFGEDGFIKIKCTFKISKAGGASDADGSGADGIKLILAGDKGEVEVFIDTYHNVEDESGNHIDLTLNGNKVGEAYHKDRLNNDIAYILMVEVRNGVITVGIQKDLQSEDDEPMSKPLIAQPIDALKDLGKNFTIQFIGITGEGYQTQDILGLSYQSNYHLDF
jgi:hypothetical protein